MSRSRTSGPGRASTPSPSRPSSESQPLLALVRAAPRTAGRYFLAGPHPDDHPCRPACYRAHHWGMILLCDYGYSADGHVFGPGLDLRRVGVRGQPVRPARVRPVHPPPPSGNRTQPRLSSGTCAGRLPEHPRPWACDMSAPAELSADAEERARKLADDIKGRRNGLANEESLLTGRGPHLMNCILDETRHVLQITHQPEHGNTGDLYAQDALEHPPGHRLPVQPRLLRIPPTRPGRRGRPRRAPQLGRPACKLTRGTSGSTPNTPVPMAPSRPLLSPSSPPTSPASWKQLARPSPGTPADANRSCATTPGPSGGTPTASPLQNQAGNPAPSSTVP
jgi:hypothetical protein